MNDSDDVNDAQAAQIDQRLGQAFAFMRDMIDAPAVLDEIPDGTRLFFRDVVWQGQQLRLTAHPSSERPGWWTARITGPAEIALRSMRWAPPPGSRGQAGKWGSPPTFPESAPTIDAALDALEEKLRDADSASRMVRGTG